MLQIATGKLFTGPVQRENQLTGTLFSNAARMFEPLVTAAGSVQWTDSLRNRTPSMTYHVTEAIEGDGEKPGLIVSHGVDVYLQDFSALMTFYFGMICSPDSELVARLTRGKAGLATKAAPNELIRRMFDPMVDVEDAPGFAPFVESLLGLQRVKFKQIMQAIRTMVTGIHRLGDDHEVAYALMVAALESLASEFGSSETKWEDLPAFKRDPIEAALDSVGAEPSVVQAVTDAMAKTEHGAKLLKFKAFLHATLPPSFFKEAGLGQAQPISKLDFSDALDTAYDLRSRYVHALTPLPDAVTLHHNFADVVILLDRRPCLSFQGLLRVARSSIVAYVGSLPQVAKEPTPYVNDLPGITQVVFAPSMWMHPDRIRVDNGKAWLEGLLEAWDQDVLDNPKPSMPDLKPSLDRAVALLPQMNTANRSAYVATILAARMTLPEQFWATKTDKVYKDWHQLFDKPTPESLVLHTISTTPAAWELEVHEEAVNNHLKRRRRANNFEYPERIEAAIMLDLAERFRAAGQWDRARHYLQLAHEYFPRFPQLMELHATAMPDVPIQWAKALIRNQATDAAG